jgi:hypothetical protein
MSTIARRRRSCRAMVLRPGTTRPSPVRSMDIPTPFRLGIAEKSESRRVWPCAFTLPFGAGCGHAGRADLLIDCEEDRIRRAVLVGKFAGSEMSLPGSWAPAPQGERVL